MSNPEQAKREYDSFAADYNDQYAPTPVGLLESQLIGIALGDLTGLTVLDLGGGSGIHAREAIELGAVAVDIVDLSPGMMKVAEDIEKSLGRNAMRFFEADAAKPLAHLPLREGGYDVVMVNWVLDFAETREVLDAVMQNAVGCLKRGGLLVGVRVANPHSTNLQTGKYGITFRRLQPFPGGVKYGVVLHCEGTTAVEFDAATLDVLRSGSPEVYETAGLTNVEIIRYEAASEVQKSPGFWKEFLEDPVFAVVKAVKK
ncbi:ubiquinone menaquinone biosynthesis C-methyltransferase [Chaetomidium leptoderma]|uniref:Ubiquinone menaquinone biosynthesis C-methyltransferase n=1 Tax=Chaetomidium leptoderma TaxID=669021 RepID=A0AAN6VJ60_9PEZI|nr:ubiquinone menaquinone biosynthesis C-methyltransferase [Chaetomidium leptoderma]